MNLGWKRLIPLGMAVVLLNAEVGMLKGGYNPPYSPASRCTRSLKPGFMKKPFCRSRSR